MDHSQEKIPEKTFQSAFSLSLSGCVHYLPGRPSHDIQENLNIKPGPVAGMTAKKDN